MTPFDARRTRCDRRSFLGHSLGGLGTFALANVLSPQLFAESKVEKWPGAIKPHHKAKIKRVIWLCMAGGPSHLETLDPKPKLAKMNGQPMPESFTKGQPIAQLQGPSSTASARSTSSRNAASRASRSRRSSRSLAEVADDLCIIRSMKTDAINHDPAHTFMNTGTTISGRPSMGSWVWYGLGAETDSLPGFVVMTVHGRSGQMQPIAARQWHSGFLPSQFQGVEFRSKGDPVLYVGSPAGRHEGPAARRGRCRRKQLNKLFDKQVDDPEIATRISQYEMAFRMQTSVPELMDSDQGNEGDPRPVRHQGGRRLVRRELPAGPAAGRARRAVHPALPPRLGPSRQREGRHPGRRQGSRPGNDGPAQGPEAPRTAGRHAGRLGRRVRPHADGPGDRPRPSHEGLLDLAGRRRRSRAASPTGRPTSSATTRSRRSSPSTTCTRRCCTCSASTTSG